MYLTLPGSYKELYLICQDLFVMWMHRQNLIVLPNKLFNPTTLFMYEPVPSQEPVIQCLSFVYVLHICFFFFHFLYK